MRDVILAPPQLAEYRGNVSDQPGDQLLFTYGSLQDAEVQLDTFGRLLAGERDALRGYTIDYAEIDDARVAEVSGLSVHPILRRTGNAIDTVVGTVKSVQNFGASDMLEIAPNEGGPTWYLPFTREAAPDLRLSEGWLRIVRPTEVDERDEV